jgi:hypothetical protein
MRRLALPLSSALGTVMLQKVKQFFPVIIGFVSFVGVISFVPEDIKVLEPFGETLPILVLIAKRYYLYMFAFPLVSLVIAVINVNSVHWKRVNWCVAALSVVIALATYMAIHMACTHCFDEVV